MVKLGHSAALLLATSCLLFGLPSLASASEIRVTATAKRSGSSQAFTVVARTRPIAKCSLAIRLPHSSRGITMPQIKADQKGRAGWRWTSVTPRKGTWRLTVRCKADKTRTATRSLRVKRGTARGTIGSPQSFRALFGSVVTKIAAKGTAGLGAGQNPFSFHQCTWWAFEKRPDVFETAVAAGAPRGGVRGYEQGEAVYVWDGSQWFTRAQAAGIPTGATPIAGALVSWAGWRGVPWGHVAYVEQVESPTRILISECNGLTLVCGSRWMNPQAYPGRLLGYVYGGPAGIPGQATAPSTPGVRLTITGTCTPSSGILVGSSSGFTAGGTATIRAWRPDGSEYTNIVHTSRVRPDGSISWTWPCAGDPAGTYTTEAIDDSTGAVTGKVAFVIGGNQPAPAPTPSTPAPATPSPAPATVAETTGPTTNKTFTNYMNAGGTLGPTIPANTTLQITCKIQGFYVSPTNPWWYKIASAPWNNQYYATADAFYNNGAKSGSLLGTPIVDNAVPNC